MDLGMLLYMQEKPDQLKSSRGIANEFTVLLPNIVSHKNFLAPILGHVICLYLRITAH